MYSIIIKDIDLHTIKNILRPIMLPVSDILIINHKYEFVQRIHRELFFIDNDDFYSHISELSETYGEVYLCLVYDTLNSEMKELFKRNGWEILQDRAFRGS